VLCLRRCCSNGHEDISKSLIRVTVHTSEHEFVHSFPKALISFSFRGRSKHCPRFSTFPCSCSSPAWLCSYGTLISRFSSWCCHGSAFARLCTDASHSCQSFVLVAHTIHRFHHRCGSLLSGYDMLSFVFVGASGPICQFAVVVVVVILRSFGYTGTAITNCSCWECRGQPRKLL